MTQKLFKLAFIDESVQTDGKLPWRPKHVRDGVKLPSRVNISPKKTLNCSISSFSAHGPNDLELPVRTTLARLPR